MKDLPLHTVQPGNTSFIATDINSLHKRGGGKSNFPSNLEKMVFLWALAILDPHRDFRTFYNNSLETIALFISVIFKGDPCYIILLAFSCLSCSFKISVIHFFCLTALISGRVSFR